MMIDSHVMPAGAHLEPFQVAGFVGGTLPVAERRQVEEHLADCESCTEEVAAVGRLYRSKGSFRRWLPAVAAAAAAIAGLAVLAPWRSGPVPPGDTLRAVSTEARIAVVAPAEGAVIAGQSTLAWRSVPRAASYRWTVTSADGDSLASAYTTDTTAVLPASVLEAPGATRHWYVDALLSDGSSVSTDMHEFRIGP